MCSLAFIYMRRSEREIQEFSSMMNRVCNHTYATYFKPAFFVVQRLRRAAQRDKHKRLNSNNCQIPFWTTTTTTTAKMFQNVFHKCTTLYIYK